MIDEILMKAIIDTIPQWYLAEYGPYEYRLNLKKAELKFFSPTPISPKLKTLFDYANRMLPMWKKILAASPLAIHVDFITAVLALKWLSIFDSEINWRELLAYLRDASKRSFENHPVTINIIISPGKGKYNITAPEFQYAFDPLVTSQQVYIRVDKQLNFMEYDEIPWSNITEIEEYKFNPEFLQPIASILKPGEISVHLTSGGDIIFMNSDGIIASRRKLFWHFYDVFNFSDSARKIFKGTPHAPKLLELMLDLSYQRRGALVVYDPNNTVIEQMVSQNSSVCNRFGSPDLFHKIISDSFTTPENHKDLKIIHKKRLFLEIAGIDGAVICNENGLLAFGAMIKPHPNVRSHRGARSTAAESAYMWGGIATGVSSDGDISIFFESSDGKNKCGASLVFM